MKRYWMIATAMLLVSAVYAQENKTQKQEVATQEQTQEQEQKTTELEELVVKGENAWIENGKAVFIPQKSAKNLARDMASLIERMNTGLLRVTEGQITTAGGKAVSLFINGVPVDKMDAATFWAKNALRVEYMESSDDPQYAGATNIVNFVMKEYVAGGLTRVSADQTFPNDGDYSASSKLVIGKMTYNAVFKGGYSRDHFSGSDMTENYKDIWYDGTYHDLITRHERSDQINRKNDIYAGINARYINRKNFVATHGVALQWNENPSSLVSGLVGYIPAIIDGSSMLSKTTARSLSPTVTGQYNYYTNKKWVYIGDWSLSHSHNNNYSSYSEGDALPFDNISRENVYNIMAKVTAQCMVTKKMYLAITASENYDIYNMSYSGNTVSRQKQRNSMTEVKLSWWYYPSDKLSMYLVPQLNIYDYKINDGYHNTDCLPGVNADIQYQLNRKSNINFHLFYAQRSPAASMRNDLILRETELRWVEGNPSLKPSDFYSLSLNFYAMPLSWLNSILSTGWSTKTNNSAISYRSGGVDYDGVVGQYLNGLRSNHFYVQWSLGLNFFDNKLQLSNSLTYDHYSVRHADVSNWVRTRTYLTWNFGNCSLVASYNSPQQWLNDSGTEKSKMKSQYDLCFSYGNGNLILDVELNNLFNKRLYTDQWFNSGPYSYTSRSWKNGRSVAVSLTYTFDYGKKVDPSIGISTQEIRSTSVLGTDK